MPVVSSAHCARCGAPLAIEPTATKQVCKFCHHEQLVTPAPGQAPGFPLGPFPPRAPMPIPQGPAPHVRLAFMGMGALVAAGALLAMAALHGSSTRGSSGSGPGSGGVTPPGERLQWGPPGGVTVVPVKIDGDATEDFVGLYRVLQLGRETKTPIFAGGFSGASFKRLWKAGPYGDLSEAAGATKMVVIGGHVVLADFRAQLHVLDVATGRETRAVKLTDKAQRLCPLTESKREVYVETVDQKSLVFDVETGQARSGAAPAVCPGAFDKACLSASARCDARDLVRRVPAGAAPVPEVDGMRTSMVLSEGPLSVALGEKSPGTTVPMAFGFETGKSAVVWKLTIPPDPAGADSTWDSPGDLAAGRFVTAYGVSGGKGWRLAAFDARTGQRQWESFVPRSDGAGNDLRSITLSATRVYVPHWTWLDVFDAATGKHIETVGVW